MYVDLGLDPVTGDLPPICRLISGDELLVQRLRVRLGLHRGEWLEDASQGMPFADWRAQKPPNLAAITLFVRHEIETTPGVKRIDALETTFDPKTRRLSFAGRIVLEDGRVAELRAQPEGVPSANAAPTLTLTLL